MIYMGQSGFIKVPLEVIEEIEAFDDDLGAWVKTVQVRDALLLAEDADVGLVAKVTTEGYAPDLTDIEVEKIGRDPFIAAYGLADLGQRCVVTTEVSRPSAQRGNRKLPDVCKHFGVSACNTFKLVRDLDFKTGWKSP